MERDSALLRRQLSYKLALVESKECDYRMKPTLACTYSVISSSSVSTRAKIHLTW
jgi:hypothetical protein